MNPKDLFYQRIGELVVPALERQGFRFIKSQKVLKRDKGEFVQQIRFEFNVHNEEDYCAFFTSFEVVSDRYLKWYEDYWGTPPDDRYSDAICACGESAIPGWPGQGTGLFSAFQPWQKRKGGYKTYCLRNRKRDVREMTELKEAIEGPLIDYMDRLSSWEGAAEHSAKSLFTYPNACDYYILAGQEGKAWDLLENTLNDETVLANPQAELVIEDLEMRRARRLEGRGEDGAGRPGEGGDAP